MDNAVVRDIIKRLDSYKEAFAHVARQLEAGGYDTATIANRMSGKAVAEFAEADKLMNQLDEVLRNEVQKSVAEQQGVSNQTKWLFALAVLITVVVVVPLTLLNLHSICKPLDQAQRLAKAIAGGDLSQSIRTEGRDEGRPAARPGRNAARPGYPWWRRCVTPAATSPRPARRSPRATRFVAPHRANRQQRAGGRQFAVVKSPPRCSKRHRLRKWPTSWRHRPPPATRGGSVVAQAVSSMHEIRPPAARSATSLA